MRDTGADASAGDAPSPSICRHAAYAAPASNPQSPVALYGRKAQMTAQVASVTPLNASGGQVNPQGGEALVRFTTVKRDMQGGGAVAPSYWVALVKYRFVGNPAKMEDRLVNPLGFQVISCLLYTSMCV